MPGESASAVFSGITGAEIMTRHHPAIGKAAAKLQGDLTPELKEKARREKQQRARRRKKESGDEPMTGEQASKLKRVAKEKGMKEAYSGRLSREGAAQRIGIIAAKKKKREGRGH
jgi:hypothetical protein